MAEAQVTGTKYDLSQNGVDQMRELARKMQKSANNISTYSSTLTQGLLGISEGFGEFKDNIESCVIDIKKVSDKCIEALNTTHDLFEKKAKTMEELLNW